MDARTLIAALIAALVAALPAAAGQEEAISEAEWRALVLGRTLVYMEDGAVRGLERYAGSGNRVEWQFADGSCDSGTWEVIGDMYCFDWESMPEIQCYRHVRDAGRILVIGTEASPAPGSVAEVTNITGLSLACGALTS